MSRTVREAEGKSGDVFPSSPGTHTHIPEAWLLFQSCFLAVLNLGSCRHRISGCALGQEWDRASAVTAAAPLAPPPTRSAALCISTLPVTSLLLLLSHQELQDLGGDILILGEEKKW